MNTRRIKCKWCDWTTDKSKPDEAFDRLALHIEVYHGREFDQLLRERKAAKLPSCGHQR